MLMFDKQITSGNLNSGWKLRDNAEFFSNMLELSGGTIHFWIQDLKPGPVQCSEVPGRKWIRSRNMLLIFL